MDWNRSNFAGTNSTLPAVNIRENDDEFMIDVAVPGMKKDQINVDYESGRLTIASEVKEEKVEDPLASLKTQWTGKKLKPHTMKAFCTSSCQNGMRSSQNRQGRSKSINSNKPAGQIRPA